MFYYLSTGDIVDSITNNAWLEGNIRDNNKGKYSISEIKVLPSIRIKRNILRKKDHTGHENHYKKKAIA